MRLCRTYFQICLRYQVSPVRLCEKGQPETAEKKLDKEQLESVSGGENSAKEFLCLVHGSHLYDIDGSTAYEIIGSDNVHTVYYNERCKRCGKIRYKLAAKNPIACCGDESR